MLVRAVARPRHRACGGATARDARSWCCRAAHAALRVSSIVVEPDAASVWESTSRESRSAFEFGRQGWRKRLLRYVRVLSNSQECL